jgi:hypothetical protein
MTHYIVYAITEKRNIDGDFQGNDVTFHSIKHFEHEAKSEAHRMTINAKQMNEGLRYEYEAVEE